MRLGGEWGVCACLSGLEQVVCGKVKERDRIDGK